MTIREHFEAFPEPYRTQALDNGRHLLDTIVKNKLNAIMGAFFWKESPQEHDYWQNFYDKLENEIRQDKWFKNLD